MRTLPLIVLKFGGSVLSDEARLRVAVHEIYRWRRDGFRVIAVVSAFAGKTDDLLSRCDRAGDRLSSLARAGIAATGELESAAFLGLHLDRAGIPASVITPAAASFVAQGDPLDAQPVSIDARVINDALNREGVVVFPGFVAVDDRSRTMVLGRGGSDLTALFLAHTLGAHECRLVKDVDALYESDPARPGPAPRRFGYANYDDALNTDGSIIQHKAVRFARSVGMSFTLARFNGVRPTTVGPGSTRFDNDPDAPIPLSVALLGPGIVGGGALELLAQLPDLFTVVGVACRDAGRHAALAHRYALTENAAAFASSGARVVVETMGGVESAHECLLAALDAGSHIVTANKALLAERGRTIRRAAEHAERRVLCSAAVGGSLPVLERCAASPFVTLRGVLNGTGNFVLEQCAKGESFESAIARAQQLGLAEADPSRDLDGRDALDKLLVIAAESGRTVSEEDITRVPITASTSAAPPGPRLRHLAQLDQKGLSVSLVPVAPDDPLFDLSDECNALVIERADGSIETLRGKGAGRWPTAESVLGDLLELSRDHALHAARTSTIQEAARA